MVNDKLFWPIEKLHEWEKNPRNITEGGFRRLKEQIVKLGQYKPLIITKEGEVLGGNMRLKAYHELGVDQVWVSIVNPKNENEKLEYALSDNDRAGYYDSDLLANLIPNYDIDWKNYSVDLREPINLRDLIQQYQDVQEDEIPEPPENPTSKKGEVYQLGPHRLMCGDSTDPEDMKKLMAGWKARLIFTDPPYNVDYESPAGLTYNSKKFGGGGQNLQRQFIRRGLCQLLNESPQKSLRAFCRRLYYLLVVCKQKQSFKQKGF